MQKKQQSIMQRAFKKCLILSLTVVLTTLSALSQANEMLAENYPERYTVVKGDTLWGISSKFLKDPWRWPEVWQGNPQVENPDLIYPGDVLVLTFIDGRPVLRSLRRETVKLSPEARSISYEDAVPPIEPSAIQAYINSPLVTDENELAEAAYVVEGLDNRLVMGKYDQFYARGIKDPSYEKYRVFRPGRHFVDPISKEKLGWEAVHIGDAQVLREGDPTRLSVLKTYNDGVAIRDRMRPIKVEPSLPFFYPKAPENENIRGVILEPRNRATEVGALSIVALNLGEREGVKPGDVFRILSQHMHKVDPVTKEKYEIPEEKVGLLMVFRTFEKISYAIITNSSRQVKPLDIVVSPNKK